MGRRIETEKKYFCINTEEIINRMKVLKFNLNYSRSENDEYFTDIESEYIKNRTCLRIRITNDEKMEVTFKGKSNVLSNTYSKLESNFDMDVNNYSSIESLFNALGYYSYTIVKKQRTSYTLDSPMYTYNVMIDNIEDLGGFVEFEIISKNDDNDEDTLRIELDRFVNLFKSLGLEEANLPYRDFVAINKYDLIKPNSKSDTIHINLDTFLTSYEKEFFKYYKKILNDSSHKILKWGMYKGNEELDDTTINSELDKKLNNYFERLKVKDSNIELLSNLISKLKNNNFKLIFTTKCNKIFISNFFERLINIDIFDKIVYLNTRGSIFTELKSNKIDISKCYNIMKYSLKDTNSLILIVLNNWGK